MARGWLENKPNLGSNTSLIHLLACLSGRSAQLLLSPHSIRCTSQWILSYCRKLHKKLNWTNQETLVALIHAFHLAFCFHLFSGNKGRKCQFRSFQLKLLKFITQWDFGRICTVCRCFEEVMVNSQTAPQRNEETKQDCSNMWVNARMWLWSLKGQTDHLRFIQLSLTAVLENIMGFIDLPTVRKFALFSPLHGH